jgi:hypothetical protein
MPICANVRAPKRVAVSNIDRLVFAVSITWLLRCWTR